MKTMKKKKLAVIGIAGMLYSATPASAQTFYQCMPVKKCRAGEYLSNNKECKSCPAGYYCINEIKTLCPYGTYALGGAQSCSECESMTYYQGPGGCHSSKNLWTRMELSVGGGGCSCNSSEANKPTTKGVCGGEVLSNTGGFGLNPYYKSVILLSCDRKTGQTYFFTANNGDKDFRFFTSSEYGAFGGGSTAVVNCETNPQTCAYKLNSDSSVLMIQR